MTRAIEAPDADINAARLQFKIECKTAIGGSRDVLERDLGWGTYLDNLLKSFYNAIAHVFTNNPNAFYSLSRAESIKSVEKAQSGV